MKRILLVAALAATLPLVGCSDYWEPRAERTQVFDPMLGSILGAPATPKQGAGSIQSNPSPPSVLATVPVEGATVTLWPYTCASLDGTPSDPVNLIFAGDADPARVRGALLALDGDRTAFGLPNAPPFNERWADAIGDVQAAYEESGGWSGSVIQLRLGEYAPIRFHLRLFRTGAALGDGGSVTVGSAHFEALIPGTADHQVLSWMVARQIVMVDMIRSGLLTTVPPTPTEVISEAPSFRAIPAVIYNGLPPALKVLIEGPMDPVSADVPLASDGRAIVLRLKGTPAAPAGSWDQAFAFTYGQVIPKPLCSDGPYDWVYVEGPVDFRKSSSVDADGRYQYTSKVSGRLTVTPVDITQNPPVPIGASFSALVSDEQQGHADAAAGLVLARSRRLGTPAGGAELLITDLKLSTRGVKEYRQITQCLAP